MAEPIQKAVKISSHSFPKDGKKHTIIELDILKRMDISNKPIGEKLYLTPSEANDLYQDLKVILNFD